MFVVLSTIDILLKKPVWCWKINTEKRTVFFYYIYALVNEEKNCL